MERTDYSLGEVNDANPLFAYTNNGFIMLCHVVCDKSWRSTDLPKNP